VTEAVVVYTTTSHSVIAHAPGKPQGRGSSAGLDVSKLPGAEVVAFERFDGGAGATTLVGCVRGPSDRFAPGIESVLFERATSLALRALAVVPSELAVARHHDEPRWSEQVSRGRAQGAELVVHHILTFAGDDRDVLVCSLACHGDGCVTNARTASLVIEGTPPEPPRANPMLRTIFLVTEHPGVSLGIALGLLLATVAIILWRRPYPRPA